MVEWSDLCTHQIQSVSRVNWLKINLTAIIFRTVSQGFIFILQSKLSYFDLSEFIVSNLAQTVARSCQMSFKNHVHNETFGFGGLPTQVVFKVKRFH